MADLDLRPLSLGEVLDRTFSLYRGHFSLFVGITAIPQLLILAYNLVVGAFPGVKAPTMTGQPRIAPGVVSPITLIGALVAVLIFLVVYLLAQGGTVYAVSELYLGRETTIGASLRRMRGHFLKLFGVIILSGLASGAAAILLIIPGIYVACRLITCVPVALLEDLGPGDALSRSFALTKNEAGRAFVIYLLYFLLAIVAVTLFEVPFTVAAQFAAKDPETAHLLLAASQVGDFLATILVAPFLTIATAVFYYDLRVRKEAFDLELMMNPGPIPSATTGIPTSFT
jgi:hypothetical protein